MKAICFNAVEDVSLQTLNDPHIETSTDAIVRIQTAGLCGSDFHPFFGREPGLDPGTVMGHEFVGEVIAVGSEVKMAIGSRVCAPFTTNCGSCFYCNSGLTSRCEHGQLFGWRQSNHGLHGGQAELVRVPLADSTLIVVPDGISNDVALLVGDNLSTGRYCAELADITAGHTYAIVGCGTVGLLALASARQLGAVLIAVDPVASRRSLARQIRAQTCAPEAAEQVVAEATDGRGVDGVMELVGLPEAQRLAYRLVRPGGTMSVIGCHCTPHFSFSPADAYDKNLTYRTGRCPARHYMPILFQELAQSTIDLSWCVTHRFSPSAAKTAYDVMSRQRDGCIKAVFDF
jgi:alcohol dehydrogenase